MTTDILQTASVQRLQGLLKHRYGKGLEVRFVVDTTDSQLNADSATVSSGDLFIPIQLHGMFLGLARIPSVQDLPSTSIEAITEVVRLILEPALYRRYLDGTPAESQVDGESGQIHLIQGEGRDSSGDVSPKAVLLQSTNPNRINRVAICLYETTERWAMLRYSDIKSFGSVREIEALGKSIIFVEDLLLLSPSEILILADYLKTANTSVQPMILVGSTRALPEIEACGHYPESMVQELARFNAELDRWPQDEKTLKLALELCLQGGSRSAQLDF